MKCVTRIAFRVLTVCLMICSLDGCDSTPHPSGLYRGAFQDLGCVATFEGKSTVHWQITTDGQSGIPHVATYTIKDKIIVSSEGRPLGEIKDPTTIDFFPSSRHFTLTRQP